MGTVTIEPSGYEHASWDEIASILRDPWLRITSGAIYKIKVKVADTTRFEPRGEGVGEKTESVLQNLKVASLISPATNSEIYQPTYPETHFSDGVEADIAVAEKIGQQFSNSEPDEDLGYDPRLAGASVEAEEDAVVLPFKPNRAQRRWLKRMWTRNVILKARQLGFTTLIAILWLDHALFNSNQFCGMIAQDRETAEHIFQDKIKLAYDHLPEVLRERMPLKACSASEIHFAHNDSKIRVATSVRGGTLDRLHVSEFGKISARDPQKAAEIVTGSFPAVPKDGILVVESTAEGQSGEFYRMVQKAMSHLHAGVKLNRLQFRLQFFPWWQEESYSIEQPDFRISAEDEEYFKSIEADIQGNKLSHSQKVWWVTTRDDTFGGDDEKMWQEYPSTPAEAFKVSTDGVYYAKQLTAARKTHRIGHFPYIPGIPVDTYWDLGAGDGTGILLGQHVAGRTHFIGYIEDWGEPYVRYTKEMQDKGYVWATHRLPHDADHKRQQGERVVSPKEELEASRIGGHWEVVPKVDDITHGINLTRQAFATACFDEVECRKFLEHLWSYRKKWDRARAAWSATPDKAGGHTEAADALRQWGQSGGTLGGGAASGPSKESLARFKRRRRDK